MPEEYIKLKLTPEIEAVSKAVDNWETFTKAKAQLRDAIHDQRNQIKARLPQKLELYKGNVFAETHGDHKTRETVNQIITYLKHLEPQIRALLEKNENPS